MRANHWNGVVAVPPLARSNDATRSIDFSENDRVMAHLAQGGIRRFLYGGNAFLYHATLRDYEALLEWLGGFLDEFWVMPSAGPPFGRAMDQAPLIRKRRFPCVMMLPCADPRDALGLETGLREFADSAETQLLLYLKDERNFGADEQAGLDVIARLVADGICAGIKYAITRSDPSVDPYLEKLLARVNRELVVSGMGERPAVTHLRDWKLPSFTTGSGCIAPRLSVALYDACSRGDYRAALSIREHFLPLEDLRDAWNPARVLHAATDLAGLAKTGPQTPFLSSLTAAQRDQLRPIVEALWKAEREMTTEANATKAKRC